MEVMNAPRDTTFFLNELKETQRMKRSLITLLLGLLVALPIGEARLACQTVATPVRTAEEPELAAALAAIEKAVEERRQSLHVPGAALVIVKDNQIILLKGFGLRDIERKLPVTPETLFGIASATKTFTALAAVISADEGKLSLDDSSRKYLPYFKLRDPEANAQVTLRDMLSHRTGLEAYGNDEFWYHDNRTTVQIIKNGMRAKPTAKFRTQGQYSNAMYIAVGAAIGKAQHSTWEEIVRSRIFRPLGMTASNFSIRAMQQTADFAWGYDDQEQKRLSEFNPDNGAAAGVIKSNAREMGQWARLLAGGGSVDGKRLVSAQGWQAMLTRHSDVFKEPYGLGLFIVEPKKMGGQYWYGHPGGAYGYAANVMFSPEAKLGFAVLANAEGSGARFCRYVTDIVILHLWRWRGGQRG
jgi:CubicO group peptidase (beta-lactamase class C family)